MNPTVCNAFIAGSAILCTAGVVFSFVPFETVTKNQYRAASIFGALGITCWLWAPWLALLCVTMWDANIALVYNREGRVIVEPADAKTLKAPILPEKQ